MLLPHTVAVAEGPVALLEPWSAGLPREEVRLVENAVAIRRAQFAAGRRRAREAMSLLGIEPACIGAGPHREPLFPPGISGTITHTADFCAAAVARISEIGHLGIDAEMMQALSAGVAGLVLRTDERPAAHTDPNHETVVFCAKEAFYKAFFQVCRRHLDFQEARVELLPSIGRFELELHGKGLPHPCALRLGGGYAVGDQRILAALVIEERQAQALREYFPDS